ncbi:MAG: multicopper oxidase family protein [bacterium]
MSRWTWTLGLLAAGCTSRPAAPPVEARVAPLALPAPAPDLDPAPDAVRVRLTAERTSEAPLRYAYNGQRPGPVIRANVGDRLTVELTNGLPAPTTIHWHGVQVPWAMDGVPWMSAPVPAGGQFTYEFNLLHPGTFWYHPHFDTEKQVDAGLYGLLIVDDPAEPAADDEVLLVFDADDEHRPATDDLPDGDPGRPAHGHGGRAAHWTVNGEPGPVQWTGRGGQRVRVRMLNASNTGYLALTWPGLRQIAGDQGLLPAPQTPDVVVLAPGDRAEFEWLLGREGFTLDRLPWSLNGGRTYAEAEPLVDVVVEAPADAPAPLALPYPGGAPSADPPYSDLIYTFSGSDRTGIWLINGERFPDVTIDSVAVGQRPVLEIRNVSASHHPFHIHGMRFEILSIDGAPPPYRRVEDTIDVGIRQRVRVQLWPDEPGDWMAHCHLLPHADDGMMTVLRVRP